VRNDAAILRVALFRLLCTVEAIRDAKSRDHSAPATPQAAHTRTLSASSASSSSASVAALPIPAAELNVYRGRALQEAQAKIAELDARHIQAQRDIQQLRIEQRLRRVNEESALLAANRECDRLRAELEQRQALFEAKSRQAAQVDRDAQGTLQLQETRLREDQLAIADRDELIASLRQQCAFASMCACDLTGAVNRLRVTQVSSETMASQCDTLREALQTAHAQLRHVSEEWNKEKVALEVQKALAPPISHVDYIFRTHKRW